MIIKNERQEYASDLTDSQWNLIAPLFPRPGNKSKWEKRELVNAVLYLVQGNSIYFFEREKAFEQSVKARYPTPSCRP